MLENLKKKSIKKVLTGSILLLIIGAALVVWQGSHAIYALIGYQQFEDLKPDEIKNQLVKINVDTVFDCYLEEYSENTKTHQQTTTHLYYITWTGDENATDYRYITIKVPKKYESRMDEIMDDTGEGIYSSPLKLTGEIKKLSEEDYGYFEEYFVDICGFSQSEFEEATSLYYINVFKDTASQNGVYLVVFFGGILLIVWAVIRIVRAYGGSYMKKFQQQYQAAGYSDATIESDLGSAVSFLKKDAVKLGRLCFYDLQGTTPVAIPVSKILWAYQTTTTHRTNGIKTGTTYSIMIFEDGRKNAYTINVPNEAASQEILQKMNAMYPWVVIGYNAELPKLFKKDRQQFLQLRYNTVEHVTVEPGFEEFQNSYSAEVTDSAASDSTN